MASGEPAQAQRAQRPVGIFRRLAYDARHAPWYVWVGLILGVAAVVIAVRQINAANAGNGSGSGNGGLQWAPDAGNPGAADANGGLSEGPSVPTVTPITGIPVFQPTANVPGAMAGPAPLGSTPAAGIVGGLSTFHGATTPSTTTPTFSGPYTKALDPGGMGGGGSLAILSRPDGAKRLDTAGNGGGAVGLAAVVRNLGAALAPSATLTPAQQGIAGGNVAQKIAAAFAPKPAAAAPAPAPTVAHPLAPAPVAASHPAAVPSVLPHQASAYAPAAVPKWTPPAQPAAPARPTNTANFLRAQRG